MNFLLCLPDQLLELAGATTAPAEVVFPDLFFFCQNSFLYIENKDLFQLLYLKLLIKIF